MVLTKLDVSFNAADKDEYLPPLPTVIAPEGGELSASAPVMKAEKSRSRPEYMVWTQKLGAASVLHSSL